MGTEPKVVQNALPGASAQELAVDAALARSEPDLFDGLDPLVTDSAVSRIPIGIDVAVPIRGFRVANLLALTRGHVIESQWRQGEDMPLGAHGTQFAWTEFEVIDQKLAVQITRLF